MSDADLEAAWPKLTATLEHEGPIPLVEFTVALQRLAKRYSREARADGEELETQLYIAEIRKGSVIVELVTQHPRAIGVAAATSLVGIVAGANQLFTFAKNLRDLLDGFKNDKPPENLTKADCDDVRGLAAPVIGTLNASIFFNINMPGETPFGLTEQEAREVDNRAALAKAKLDLKDDNIHTEVLMVWDQVKDAPGVEEGRSPDKGVIAVISKAPKQIRFASDDLKEQMGWHGFNPFEKAFVVDVKELIGPAGTVAYTILKLHDVLDRE